jgi:sterol 3beta-glucosyltransferase
VHAGTQTLIQALQAIPWTDEPDNDDEIMNSDMTPDENETDEDMLGSQVIP